MISFPSPDATGTRTHRPYHADLGCDCRRLGQVNKHYYPHDGLQVIKCDQYYLLPAPEGAAPTCSTVSRSSERNTTYVRPWCARWNYDLVYGVVYSKGLVQILFFLDM